MNAKTAVQPENAPTVNLKTHLSGNLSPLIPPRRERRAAWRALPKLQRPPWSMLSLGRPTHRLEAEKVKPYARAIPVSVADIENVERAESKRQRRRGKWERYVS